MAIVDKIFGANVFMYVNETLVACAKSMSVSATRKELDTTCSGSGDTEQAITGKAKYTWDIDILWRQTSGADISTNVTAYDLINIFQNKTPITIVDMQKEADLANDDEIYTGVGYITNFKKSATLDSVDSFTCSGFFNSYAPTRYVD